jgi:Abortive infection alpha
MNGLTPNLPGLLEKIAEKGLSLLEKLFGGSLTEFDNLFKDKIRYRRFKNQLKILAKANDLLKENKLKPKEMSLKLLVPLLEYSSLEEEPELQEKWARLIASASVQEDKDLITRNYVEILNKLSVNEVKILDYLFDVLLDSHKQNRKVIADDPMNDERIYPGESRFGIWDISNHFNFEEGKIKYYLDSLITTGLLKWDLANIVDGGMPEAMIVTKEQKIINVHNAYELNPTPFFLFTNLGIGFVKACRFMDSNDK